MIRAGISHFSKNTLSLKNNLLKSCTTNKESGKSSPGVVVAIKDNCGYAMTANPIAAGIQWSTEYVNTGAFQSTLQSMAITDFDACGNTQKIIQAGTASTYPAAWAVVNYSPTVAPTSKGKWYLPTAGMLNSLYINLNAINNTISKLGGTQLTDINECTWSSSEYGNSVAGYSGARVFCTICNDGLSAYDKDTDEHHSSAHVVRPVIAF